MFFQPNAYTFSNTFSKKKDEKDIFRDGGIICFCGITIFIVPMIGKLMYMEPRVGEGLVSWKDMLLLVMGILILVIISERLKEN